MQPTSQHSMTSWLWQGLIFGLLLGLVLLITWQATFAIPIFPIRMSVSFLLPPLLSFVAGFFVGMRVSRQTGKMKAGVLAGFITGLCAGMLFLIVSYIYITIQLYGMGHTSENPLSFLQSSSSLVNLGQRLLPAFVGGIIGGAVGREDRKFHSNISSEVPDARIEQTTRSARGWYDLDYRGRGRN